MTPEKVDTMNGYEKLFVVFWICLSVVLLGLFGSVLAYNIIDRTTPRPCPEVKVVSE